MNLENITAGVSKLAIEVGAFIRQERKIFSLDKVEYKGGKSDLVSYVDKEAERMIVTGLKQLIPDGGFITEEETTDQKPHRNQKIIYRTQIITALNSDMFLA